MAIRNAKLFAERQRGAEDMARLRAVLGELTARLPEAGLAPTRTDLLSVVASAVCDAFGALSCVASAGSESSGAFGAGQDVDPPRSTAAARGTSASLIVARDCSGHTDLTLAVTLSHPPGDGQAELLDLIAAATAVALTAHRPGD